MTGGYTRAMDKPTRSLLAIALLAVALPATLAACGNKGPLVKPSEIEPVAVPAEPATATGGDTATPPPADTVPPPADPEATTPPTPDDGNG